MDLCCSILSWWCICPDSQSGFRDASDKACIFQLLHSESALIVGIIAAFATIKRKDLFFLIDDDKIEFRYGIFNHRKKLSSWTDINKLDNASQGEESKTLF